MPLKTIVKVGNITNLSDARYCSGMGVEMLGFQAIESRPNHITPKLFQEIRRWIPGPKVVAEVYGLPQAGDLEAVLSQYAPDYVELSLPEYQQYQSALRLPAIVSLTREQLSGAPLKKDAQVAFILIQDSDIDAA